MNPVLRRILSLIPPALLVGFVVYFSSILYWNGDSVLYQFVYQDEDVYFTWEPIRNLDSLWRSITRHYMEVNGRFVCHFIVMLIVSFVPQWLFALLSGGVLAALLWMICRMACVTLDRPAAVLSVTLMSWLAFDNLTDPAFYINYVWMGTLVVGWLIMFLRHPDIRNPLALAGIGLFSLIAGQAHECLALPVGLALLIYLFTNRFRVSRFDWVAGTCFCVAGATTFLAPGLFVRIDNTLDMGFQLPPRYDVFLLTILPILFIWTLWRFLDRLGVFFADRTNRFWLWVIIANLILILVTLGHFGTRTFTIGSVGMIILIIRLAPRHHLNLFWTCALGLMAVWLTWVRWHYTHGLTAKYLYTENVFLTEHPDTVWIPDNLFLYESRFCDNLEEHVTRRYMKAIGNTSPGAPHIFKALPASLRDVPRDFNGNICRRLGKDLYLLVQSKQNPARFYSHKRLFPNTLDLEFFPDRELIFGDNRDDFDIFVDSTATWRAAFYSQEYFPYADFEIRMEE